MYINLKKYKFKILGILVLLFIVNTLFINFESFAISTKEITIKYLDENGNTIKPEEKKQIEMGNEGVTKYVSSYKEIPNGTDLFPDEISGYIIQSAKIKTYYNGEYRESGFPDEGSEYSLIDNERVAITSPKSTDLYIVEFIYEKDNNVGNLSQEENSGNNENKENAISNNENINLSTNDNITIQNNTKQEDNLVKNDSTTNNSLPQAGGKNRFSILILLSIIVLVISIIKYNTYKKY